MPQSRPMRAWSSTPFAMGPKGNGPQQKRRRVPMGGMMPVHPASAPLPVAAAAPVDAVPEPMPTPAPDPAKIVCTEGGPYLCYGASVEAASGGVAAPADGKPLALCACGRSAKKPFCDGAHKQKAADPTPDPTPEPSAD